MKISRIAVAFGFVTTINTEGFSAGASDETVTLRGSVETLESVDDQRKTAETEETEETEVSTKEQQDPNQLGALWKLHYEKGIRWENRGTDFCVMCRGAGGCVNGTRLVINYCNQNDDSYRWKFKRVDKGVVQIKVKKEDLCVTRVHAREYELRPCDTSDRQIFNGYVSNGKFQLEPFGRVGRTMTMHHRPKGKGKYFGEEILDMPSSKAELSDTLYWEAEYREREYPEDLKLKIANCTESDPCQECEGECKTDSDCNTELKCWDRVDIPWRQRLELGLKTPWEKVPGCSGVGEFAQNYCYNPINE
uniref:Ricin B lectin domain-containing protein n=1 Tax=Odontella aurita TaxID=265563 RepID=A0A7S4I6R4_9STRA|mmetsp:Transcript_2072/g.5465  ORF Transcript_2072/g.5465 Transcript_2072/m.5465 type:complete len:306 (+) Transcript_2072:224-1141(+)|eukprot:CAMPEP_0113542188 /NCGR_PEP_ID=MMETSP0015_2-20120614/9463_1 /TAXON_ID=2838 /ORGANISM="Odontella" /LENGTH=305 /DNA_ID=CAMNT_0000442207 /DNA_START=144 /DNA_END=1061 /DNA_ORIENTATION=- /assembly_acc=CAM_ASM_000160